VKPSDFSYDLPAELIAQHPPPRRRDSRLLHLPAQGVPVHRRFAELPNLLSSGEVLVLNETRVLPARLCATRASGGIVELLLLEPERDANSAVSSEDACERWRAMAKPARRIRPGEILTAGDSFHVRVVERAGPDVRVEFLDASAEDVLEQHGEVPLPPYLHRDAEPEDRARYQTVYARVPGAVAAPTAGLHFDAEMLDDLRGRGIEIASIVLHVGPGTFRPLPEEDVDLSQVHLDPERFEIPEKTAGILEKARARGSRVIACGTTVARALETFARGKMRGTTSLFSHPPFRFEIVDALLTNFHLPRSSLLCLVSAFAGRERILSAYEEAVRERYRFYSYGDATFLERAQ
jgi:S-adenosylmethionine:tRNA ribosyltransferase-isomerase